MDVIDAATSGLFMGRNYTIRFPRQSSRLKSLV